VTECLRSNLNFPFKCLSDTVGDNAALSYCSLNALRTYITIIAHYCFTKEILYIIFVLNVKHIK